MSEREYLRAGVSLHAGNSLAQAFFDTCCMSMYVSSPQHQHQAITVKLSFEITKSAHHAICLLLLCFIAASAIKGGTDAEIQELNLHLLMCHAHSGCHTGEPTLVAERHVRLWALHTMHQVLRLACCISFSLHASRRCSRR